MVLAHYRWSSKFPLNRHGVEEVRLVLEDVAVDVTLIHEGW